MISVCMCVYVYGAMVNVYAESFFVLQVVFNHFQISRTLGENINHSSTTKHCHWFYSKIIAYCNQNLKLQNFCVCRWCFADGQYFFCFLHQIQLYRNKFSCPCFSANCLNWICPSNEWHHPLCSIRFSFLD